MSAHARFGASPSTGLSLQQMQHGVLWLFVASGWLVVIKPSPYEILFVPALMLFVVSGLKFELAVVPFIVLLLTYNVGGILSLLPVAGEFDNVLFTIISILMAATALFFALVVSEDTTKRLSVIRNACIIAAVVAATGGLIGYFDIAGMRGQWAPILRAQGTFKDPNVFAAFLVPPLCFRVQGFLLGTQRHKFLSLGALLIIAAGLFFAFSRGAWLNAVAAICLLAAITFMVTPSARLRSRIVALSLCAALIAVLLIGFALSFEEVRSLFEERANFINSYDGGETGRFGNQLNSLPMLAERPNGLGPFQFSSIFGADPHNVYLNSFAAYGWLGGVSFRLLVMATVSVGWKSITTRSPWQSEAIVIFCPLVTTLLQSVQIDSDHWRHLFLLMGLMWGLYAAIAPFKVHQNSFVEA